MPQTIENVLIPDYLEHLLRDLNFCQHILRVVKSSLSIPIYNHSVRVFLLAVRINDQDVRAGEGFKMPSLVVADQKISREYLFAACMFHDMGTCSEHNGPQRFEVEGADAAVALLSRLPFSRDEEQLQQVWTAIAMHSCGGIAERLNPMTSLVRRAVRADFDPTTRDSLGLTNYAAEIEALLPRLDVEQVLAAEVVAQATRGEKEKRLSSVEDRAKWSDSAKFPKASWSGILLRAHLEKVRDEGQDWKGPNPAF